MTDVPDIRPVKIKSCLLQGFKFLSYNKKKKKKSSKVISWLSLQVI